MTQTVKMLKVAVLNVSSDCIVSYIPEVNKLYLILKELWTAVRQANTGRAPTEIQKCETEMCT
jgi:hypothetical protein